MSAMSEGSADVLVRRRHVLYVEGYDPQGAEGYHNLFSRSFRRFLNVRRINTFRVSRKGVNHGEGEI